MHIRIPSRQGGLVYHVKKGLKGNEMSKPAVFIDRDGTINEQMGYINHLSRFKVLPGVPEAIKLLNGNGNLAIIVSNQSGVGRGYFPIKVVHQVHDHLEEILKDQGAKLDGIYFCPHYPKGAVPEYSEECDCRKPKTGLIEQACKDHDINLSASYVIGDRITDIELARRASLKSVMVKTGYGRGDIEYVLPQRTMKPDHIAEDLLDAVRWIIS